MLRARTNTRGEIALNGFKGDKIGMDWIIALTRKYMFAYRLNCIINETGRYDNNVYLENIFNVNLLVLIKLDGYSCSYGYSVFSSKFIKKDLALG